MSAYKDLRDSVWARAWNAGLTSPQLLVALRLVEHWPNIFPGEKRLAQFTRLGESTVRAAIKELESLRVIRVEREPGRVNHYHFLDPDGRDIGRSFPDIGPPPGAGGVKNTPPGASAPPRQEPAHPPPGASAPTPPGASAEADPDLKQETKRPREAGGTRPVPKWKFDKSWKPSREHLALGISLGLSREDILQRAHDCKNKLYERAFDTEDEQFNRELPWAAADKQTKLFKESRKANPHDRIETPGRGRRPDDPRPEPVFGRIRPG